MRRFAPAGRRSLPRLSRCRVFQRLEKCPRQSSNVWKSSRNAVSSRRFWRQDSLISTPAMFQVPFPPCSAGSTRRKPSLQTRPPKPPGNSPRVCAYGANVTAICLFGGKTCRALFLFSRPAPLRLPLRGPSLGSRLRRSADWFSNLRIQSINQTPFAHRFASNAPPRLSALVSPFRARTPVARYAMEASGLVCLWQTPGVSGPPRSARYASSGAALAPLFKDRPPDPCARDAHPEDVPRAGSQAPRQQSWHVACLPEDRMR